ncbi:MAG: hypothetical protein A2Z27_05195 [candidate division Zixibacteria bacterium RBG_16_50_21]|nr:MAG: hypothetical protein A2Z27_05195 [candidate division Zixibacteria bacterium RBG_16_50_21]
MHSHSEIFLTEDEMERALYSIFIHSTLSKYVQTALLERVEILKSALIGFRAVTILSIESL